MFLTFRSRARRRWPSLFHWKEPVHALRSSSSAQGVTLTRACAVKFAGFCPSCTFLLRFPAFGTSDALRLRTRKKKESLLSSPVEVTIDETRRLAGKETARPQGTTDPAL